MEKEASLYLFARPVRVLRESGRLSYNTHSGYQSRSLREGDARTLLYTDSLFLKHGTGAHHPESPERLRAITARLEKKNLIKKCTAGTYKPLNEETVSKLHTPKLVTAAKQLAEHGGGRLDADTVVSPDSFKVALAAAGAAVAAVDAVMASGGGEGSSDRNALCLIRPPGHHATPTKSMGFCLFNNIALAARHATSKHELTRVLIVDWDVHHGNGTQDIFYGDGQVSFLSIHRYPFWPGTGNWDETG